MSPKYSTYMAKARFSQLIGEVREGQTVTVTYRGKPVAEVRPIRPPEEMTNEERLDAMERRGVIVKQPGKRNLRPIFHAPGALARFLKERHED